MTRQWIIITFLLAVLTGDVGGLGQDRQYKCDWQMDLVNRAQGGTSTKYVTPDSSIYQDITKLISNIDLTPDNSDVKLFAYDFNIRIQLSCQIKADEQSYVAQGGTPIVSVFYPPQTTYDQTPVGPVMRQLYGAIIDTAVSEDIEVNSPAWVVPLPLDSCQSIMGVNTRGEGGGEILPNTRSFEVLVASLTDNTGTPDDTHMGTADSAPPGLAGVMNEPRPPPTFVPVYNSGYVYGPLDDNGVYLFAYRDFSDGSDAKFLLNTKLSTGLGVCTCSGATDHPRLMAALPQRILMFGKDGLTEVRGNFVHMHSTENTVIRENTIESSIVNSDACISQLIVNNQIDLLQEWTAVGVGACSNINELFVAEVKHSMEAPMNFTALNDFDLNALCGGDCNIVTAVVWAEGISKITVLAKSDTNQEYYLIDYTKDRLTSTATSVVTARIGYDQNEDPATGEAVTLSLAGVKQTGLATGTPITLTLTGLSLRPFSSNDIFIWGNRILYSPDRGRTVLLIPWPTTPGATNLEIRALPVSQSGLYTVLVQNSAPAAGENPTQIWASYTSLPNELYQIYETVDFYVATHHQQNDRNGYTWAPDTVIVSIWWQQDIYQEDTLKLLGYSPSQQSGLDGIQNLELNVYLLVEMVRDTLQDHTDLGSQEDGDDKELLWANHLPDKCSVANIVFKMPPELNTLKLQELRYKPPRAFDGANETILYSDRSILAYHAVVVYLDQLQDSTIASSYLNTDYQDSTEQWRGEMQSSVAYRDYTFQYGAAPGGFDIDVDDYTKNYPHYEDGSQPQITQLPDNIYIGHKETFWFLVSFILKDEYFYWDYSVLSNTANQHDNTFKEIFYNEDFDPEGYDNTLSVTVTDPNLVNIRKELVQDDRGDVLTYNITITDKGNMPLSIPGDNLIPVGLQIVAHNTPFRCYTDYTQFGHTPLGLQRTNVIVGCAPQLRIQFDALETVRAVTAAGFKYFDCPLNSDPKMPCFYFSTEFLPRFRIQDLLTGSSKNYNGKYSLRIIGGSSISANDIEMFSAEEIFKYNNKNAKGSGSVFGHSSGQYTKDGWPLFTEGTQSVVWLCLSESPCADVNPKFPLPPEYYFLVRFSNVGTGEDATNCNLQLDFVVRVHGLHVNFYKKSLPLFLGSMFLMLIYILVYFYCHRKDDVIYNRMLCYIERLKERIIPKQEIDDDFLAEYRANYQKRKIIAKNVSAVRRPGETIELGLSYQGLSYLRAAHGEETGGTKLPEVTEEEDDEVVMPAATLISPYLAAFAMSSQTRQRPKGEEKGYNPMKGKSRNITVPKKELFVEVEELLKSNMSLDKALDQDIIRPKKTPEIPVEDEDGEQLVEVIESSGPESTTVETSERIVGPDGKPAIKRVRRMSTIRKVPKSDINNLQSDVITKSAEPGKRIVKKIIRRTTKDGEVKTEEMVTPSQEAARVLSNRATARASSNQEAARVPSYGGPSQDQSDQGPEESRDELVRKSSGHIVHTAIEEAKKSLSEEHH